MPEPSEWSVPWPDGSWLTWNEDTESWEKQAEPPGAAPKTDEPAPSAAKVKPPGTPKAPASTPTKPPKARPKPEAQAEPPAKVPSKKAPAKKAPEPTKRVKAPSEPPPASATAPVAAAPRDVSTEQRWSWQPVSDASQGSTRVRPASKPSSDRSVWPSSRPSVGARPVPAWSMIAAGAAVGVAAGYLLMNLIR